MTLTSVINDLKEPQLIRGVTDFIRLHAQNFLQSTEYATPVIAKNSPSELLTHFEILNQSALLSVSDLHGNILHANEKFCEISKYKLEELLHQPHSIIRHPDTPSEVFKDMWNTIGKGKTWKGEFKNRAKDGSAYWVITTIAPILGINGKPVKYISVRYDITKQKLVEEQLREAKKKMDNELLENIQYAKYIHSTFLSNNEDLESLFCESFLVYRAQKIISGDFYKIEKKDNKIMLAVGDSTGHGVSASYISVLALNILSRVMEFCSGNPAKILRMMNLELNRITRINKKQQLTESADAIVCCIDMEAMKLTYSSANMRALIIRGEQVILLEKDKCTIGEMPEKGFKITSRHIGLEKGDRLYIFSDGLTDQIGGPKNKCIGVKRILSLIKETHNCSAEFQKKVIEDSIIQWQGENEQTDDITLLSVKI